jgi:hypothetical protein
MGLVFICRLAGDADHSTQSLLGGRGGCKEIARSPQRPPNPTNAEASSSGRRKLDNRSRDHRIVGKVAVGDEDAIQTPGNEDSVGLRLRREQVEFVNEVPGQLVDIGDQFSARYESEMQPPK